MNSENVLHIQISSCFKGIRFLRKSKLLARSVFSNPLFCFELSVLKGAIIPGLLFFSKFNICAHLRN